MAQLGAAEIGDVDEDQTQQGAAAVPAGAGEQEGLAQLAGEGLQQGAGPTDQLGVDLLADDEDTEQRGAAPHVEGK